MSSLFIKIDFGNAGASDTGTRPYTGTTPLWNNASMWLDGGPSQTETNVGNQTLIRVRVSNAGQAPVEAVNVDAYVLNPFVGLFNPNNAIRRLSGFANTITPGSGSSSALDPHVVTCRIQDPVQGPIAWTPTSTELANTVNGSGHLCMVANAYAENDGGVLNDTTPFNVAGDPHQGQRNITLLAAQQLRAFHFDVAAAPQGEVAALDFHQLPAALALGAGERWLMRSRGNIALARDLSWVGLALTGRPGRPKVPLSFSRKAIRGSIELEGLGSAALQDLARATRRAERTTGFRAAGRGEDWGEGRLVFGVDGDSRPAVLRLERSDQPGSVQAFDIVQRDRRGTVLGGLRVLSIAR